MNLPQPRWSMTPRHPDSAHRAYPVEDGTRVIATIALDRRRARLWVSIWHTSAQGPRLIAYRSAPAVPGALVAVRRQASTDAAAAARSLSRAHRARSGVQLAA